MLDSCLSGIFLPHRQGEHARDAAGVDPQPCGRRKPGGPPVRRGRDNDRAANEVCGHLHEWLAGQPGAQVLAGEGAISRCRRSAAGGPRRSRRRRSRRRSSTRRDTSSRNSVPSPTSCLGSGKTSSILSSARIGPPAAIRPTTGTYVAVGIASPTPVSSNDVSSAGRDRPAGGHQLGEEHLERARPVGVAAYEPLLLQHLELVGHARGAGQPDRLADLAHARRVAALLHVVLEVRRGSAAGAGSARSRPEGRREARRPCCSMPCSPWRTPVLGMSTRADSRWLHG